MRHAAHGAVREVLFATEYHGHRGAKNSFCVCLVTWKVILLVEHAVVYDGEPQYSHGSTYPKAEYSHGSMREWAELSIS